jgi:hypothetical protein
MAPGLHRLLGLKRAACTSRDLRNSNAGQLQPALNWPASSLQTSAISDEIMLAMALFGAANRLMGLTELATGRAAATKARRLFRRFEAVA